MVNSVQCPGCLSRYAVTAQLAGRSVKCKACGQVMAIPAVARAPAMAGGGGLEYDLDGALAMTHEQTKIPMLEPARPPEYEHVPSAIGGGIVTIFATSILAGILIVVGKQIELGIIAVILGLVCTGIGVGLFVYKLPLGGFSTLAGWTLACLIGTGVTCFIVFTAPGPAPPPKPIARNQPATLPTIQLTPQSAVDQAKAVIERATSNASDSSDTRSLEEQLAQARMRTDIAEMRRIVLLMEERARKQREEFARKKADARKMPLVQVVSWQMVPDPRSAMAAPALIAPEMIRFQNIGRQVRASCFADDEFGSSALLYTGGWDEGVVTNRFLEQWDFKTGKRTNTFDITPVHNGMFVSSQDGSKLFARHFQKDVRHALEARDWKTGELLDQTTAEIPLALMLRRGPQDSMVIVSITQPITIHTYKTLQATPTAVALPADEWPMHPNGVVCQSPGGRYLVMSLKGYDPLVTDARKFYVVDVLNSTVCATFTLRPFVNPQAAFSPDGKELAVWCEEDEKRQSVAFINVTSGKVDEHDGIGDVTKSQVSYPGRKLGYTRSGSHLIYEGRFLLPRQNPAKIIQMDIPYGEWIILFGEFLGTFRSAGDQSEFQIVRLENLPES